jgi:hypothetical protein
MKSQGRRVGAALLARLALSIGLGVALAPAPAPAAAADETANLGEGLKQLVAPATAARASARAAAASGEPEVAVTSPVQFDDADRALVRISLDGSPTASQTLASLQQMAGVEVVASDLSYGPGLVEAYVPVEQLLSIARTKGVLAIVPSGPMVTNVGATDSQGVVQHRVDQLPAGVDGSGITVGVMSDSYDTNVAPNSAALDIASGDLPGVGNPAGNTEPVVVLQDSPARTDEGRAMLQSSTISRRRRGSASRRHKAGSSTSRTTSARSPATRPRPTSARASRPTSSSTTSSISTSRSFRMASSRRRSMKWWRKACRTSPRPATVRRRSRTMRRSRSSPAARLRGRTRT